MSESDNGSGPVAHIPPEGTLPIALEEEMRRSYLDYAMSVIVSRALPDVRDGLKPVHRRILFSMQENGFTADKPYKKSARVVGDVMGKYHPHGDSAIYDAMVRMAQTFSLRVPLIDGQGNFGSMDGDPAAAMRYTEARLAKSAVALLEGIDEDTVEFGPNYDESAQEPKVLPAAFPNLLVNGANGIAVGMATNIPPHNPAEVIDATLAMITEPEITLEELMKIIPGPDFPTGALILGRSGIRSAFETGRGSVVLRARAEIEEMRGGRSAIAISEIPYQVNKATLIERIAELVRSKQMEGISDLRDESDRSGLRIVVELKKDATPEVVLNHLYRYTNLQTSFAVNMLALHNGRPQQMGLRQVLQAFIDFREEVILRRSRYRLGKARDRGHLLVGLAIAVANIDEVIRLIRESPDAVTARNALMDRDWPIADVGPLLALVDDAGNIVADEAVRLTEAQARGILELRLQRLTGLERDKIHAELDEVAGRIRELLEILSSRPRRLELMAEELRAVRAQIASPRLSEIVEGIADQDDESLVEPGLMVVTLTRDGYVKRTPLETFRAQNRGGRGRSSAGMRQDDVVVRSFNAHTHQWVLFFTSRGMAFREKVWKLPEAGPTARGRSLRQLLPLQEGEGVTAVLPLPQDEDMWENLHLVFATAQGNVRRNRLSDFKNVRSSGLIAMKLDEGDGLIGVSTCREGDDVLLATHAGRAIRFRADLDTLRVFAGRDSTGVRGIRLGKGDAVIALSVLRHVEASVEERAAYLKQAAQRRRNGEESAEAAAEAEASLAEENAEEAATEIALSSERFGELEEQEEILLTVTDGGFGKRSSAYEYRVTGRGGQGIGNINLTARTGRTVVATFPVRTGDGVMLVTDTGRLIRLPIDQVRITGRQAMGVTLLRLGNGERVISCSTVVEETGSDAEGSGDAEGGEPEGGEGNG
ncbi:DNA gyrase subunit A [Roseomonas sp. E05]|nr:DNA gyrase subunit A [Roseomonas sp. E05]MDJ0389852.1 DNA gyrase subunit A [Roseomonas sp. E05]